LNDGQEARAMTMKLSEAIRLGAMATPKADGVFFDRRNDATCAQLVSSTENSAGTTRA
jgi:hypothetical protein